MSTTLSAMSFKLRAYMFTFYSALILYFLSQTNALYFLEEEWPDTVKQFKI